MDKRMVLITMTGQDRPGIIAAVTGHIAAAGARIRDIEQTVTHTLLSFSVLIDFPTGESERTPLIKDLLFLAKELGLDVQFMSHGAPQNAAFAKIAGSDANGFISGSPRWDENSPRVQAFIKRYTAKYNHGPDLYGPYFYDAVRLFAAAIEKGGYSRDGIRKGLKELGDFPGVNGTMNFEKSNVALLPLRFVKYENGTWVPVKD